MKRIALAAAAVCLILSGCADQVAQTPAQASASLLTAVHKSCAAAQPFIDQVPTIYATLTPEDQVALPMKDITKVTDAFATLCSTGAPEPLTVTSVTKALFPVMIKLVNTSSLAKDKKAEATIALGLAQSYINVVTAQ
jgi:hypothetical protein